MRFFELRYFVIILFATSDGFQTCALHTSKGLIGTRIPCQYRTTVGDNTMSFKIVAYLDLDSKYCPKSILLVSFANISKPDVSGRINSNV